MVKDYRITQQKAAVTLGITQAAISKYLKENSDKYTGIRIDPESLRNFAEMVKLEDEQGAQKIMCRLCQINGKFECTFMVK
jgi:predicted transcriptional regulator